MPLYTAVGQAPTPLHVSTQELNNLAAGSMHQDLSIAPDRFVMLALGVFVLVAVTVMRVDIIEMAEQLRNASSLQGHGAESLRMSTEDENSAVIANSMEEVTRTTAGNGRQLYHLHVCRAIRAIIRDIICMCAGAVSVLALLVSSALFTAAASHEPSLLHASAQELHNLAGGLTLQDLPMLHDKLVMFALGTFILLAAVIMKTDVDEMAKEANSEEEQPCGAL